ncbi:type II toxin-antitoxin system Phd/YefM family antitoxin [Glycomyces tenuis]|uniref:type II toxin-antitoxin system Phd/YefM family antitoxin n=1 Tax=Glycomyces tenuis TaxID=58116 RepID=UPI00047A81C0|nr:type II toxin-antitoxin system Phd/YefM family antitoxin [Glycomyces tenuis]
MNTISQRELRNNSAAVMNALERGESFILTRNGMPVGEVRPYSRHRKFTASELVERASKLPRLDYERMRAEADAFFGEDRLGDDDPWDRPRG